MTARQFPSLPIGAATPEVDKPFLLAGLEKCKRGWTFPQVCIKAILKKIDFGAVLNVPPDKWSYDPAHRPRRKNDCVGLCIDCKEKERLAKPGRRGSHKNGPVTNGLPSAADLDAHAAEQKIAEVAEVPAQDGAEVRTNGADVSNVEMPPDSSVRKKNLDATVEVELDIPPFVSDDFLKAVWDLLPNEAKVAAIDLLWMQSESLDVKLALVKDAMRYTKMAGYLSVKRGQYVPFATGGLVGFTKPPVKTNETFPTVPIDEETQ